MLNSELQAVAARAIEFAKKSGAQESTASQHRSFGEL